jgi:hypothetical protein
MLVGIFPVSALANAVSEVISVESPKMTVANAVYGGNDSTTPSALTVNIDAIDDVLETISDSSYYLATSADWKVMDLARYGKTDNINYNEFIANAIDAVNNPKSSITNLEKVAIALTAVGIDVTAFDIGNDDAVNLVNLIDIIKTHPQLLSSANSLSYGLLALFAGDYLDPVNDEAIANELVAELLITQINDKGWSWNSSEKINPDIDTTAMVLSALAPYYIDADESSPVKIAVNNTLAFLADKQTEEGGFASEYFDGGNLWVTYNANTTATVALGLIALGIDPNEDERFVKGEEGHKVGVIDALMTFKTEDNFFGYMGNQAADEYATEQSFRTLVAYKQFLKNGRKPTSIYYSGSPTGTYTVSKESLNNLITEANNRNKSDYTNASWTNFSDKLNEAIDIFANEAAAQAVITSAYHNLIQALSKLETRPITPPSENNITVSFSVNGSNIGTILPSRSISVPAGSTVEYVIVKALNDAGISFTNIGGYISEVAGIKEFTSGVNSGWAYYINGVAPSITGIRGYILSDNEQIELRFINDYTIELEYEGSSTLPKQDNKDIEKDSKPNEINKDFITELLKAQEVENDNSRSSDNNKQKEIVLKLEQVPTEDIKEIVPAKLSLSAEALKTIADTKEYNLKLESEQVSLIFDPKSLQAITNVIKDDNKIVSIVVTPINNEQLTEQAKSIIEDRPVYDFAVMVDDTVISTFDGGEITVAIPYTAKTSENNNALVIYYISEDNRLELIKNSRYDAKTNLLKFSINHFSSFGVGYNEVYFPDVTGIWMQDAVEYMAAREIVFGIDNNRFLPDREITRAEFVTILMRMLEIDVDTKENINFNDVDKNNYYYEPVLAAKKLGLVSGIGQNSFNPNTKISRQEMFTIVYRALDNNSSQAITNNITFSDIDDVADYALVAIEQLAVNKLINGDNGKVKPLANASRAEATQFLYNILTNQELISTENNNSTSNNKNDERIKANTVQKYIDETATYLQKTVTNPTVATVGGEWTIISLARANIDVPNSYYDKYYNNLKAELDRTAGKLHHIKYTEYDRVILALSAIGKNATNIDGYDLTEPLIDFNAVVKQGLNGAIWALIALDSGNYQFTNDGTNNSSSQNNTTREKIVDYILSKEIETGGWSLGSTDVADINTTAMALQALANYQDNKDVLLATNRALNYLSQAQLKDGKFISEWDTEANSESIANVIVALTALGIDPKTEIRFIKNEINLISALLEYYQNGGGFKHVIHGQIDLMATDQGLYALVAYERFLNGLTCLYDMTDSLQ